MARRPKTKLQRAEAKLAKAIKRLDPSQGRVGRTNARTAVLGALRDVRAAVDGDYPNIKKAPKRPRHLSVNQRERKLRQEGWLPVGAHTGDIAGACNLARWLGYLPVSIKRSAGLRTLWAPAWVIAGRVAGLSIARLKKIKRSPQQRRALVAAWELKRRGSGDD